MVSNWVLEDSKWYPVASNVSQFSFNWTPLHTYLSKSDPDWDLMGFSSDPLTGNRI